MKLGYVIVDYKSLPEKPRWDKKDVTVVEQYPLAPTSIAQKWRPTIRLYWDT